MSEHKLKNWVHRSASIAQFAADMGVEITDVVENMHGTIQRSPRLFPWLFTEAENTHTKGITGFVYSCVKSGFELNHAAWHALADWAKTDETDPAWLQFRSIINGVFGNTLAEQDNPLALPMSMVNETPAPPQKIRRKPPTLLLYIHGLCMNEAGWENKRQAEFTQKIAKKLGARTAYLRYNSGLHISENGQALADLLEEYTQNDSRIVIIGHSMGGLLTRSACHYGQQANHTWVNKLTHLACLGTPHHGAKLERIGNIANTLLKVSPFSRPLMGLGNLRSAGIQDLRFGNLRHEDWRNGEPADHYDDIRQTTALLPHIQYLFSAATLSETTAEDPRHNRNDMLVTVASAWGNTRDEKHNLDADNITRQLHLRTDHLELIASPHVYQGVEEWLLTR